MSYPAGLDNRTGRSGDDCGMSIVITEEALAVLRRSLELGKVDRAAGGVRLRGARGLTGDLGVQVELAEGPFEGESVVEQGGVRVFVDPDIIAAMGDAIVTLEPQHEVIVVRPAGAKGPAGQGP